MTTLTINRSAVNDLYNQYSDINDIKNIKARDIAVRLFQVNGANAVNDLIASDEINPDTANQVLGSLVDLQVRDYAIGITDDSNINKLANIWAELAKIAPAGAIAPVATLCAVVNYELGNEKISLDMLKVAQDDESQYPLALLIARVIKAGWGAGGFALMRKQLHHKVVATIYGTK